MKVRATRHYVRFCPPRNAGAGCRRPTLFAPYPACAQPGRRSGKILAACCRMQKARSASNIKMVFCTRHLGRGLTQHEASMKQEEIRELIRGVVTSILPQGWMPEEKQFFTNPTGQFVIGGPDGDLPASPAVRSSLIRMAVQPAWRRCILARSDQGRPFWLPTLHVTEAKNVVAAGLADRCTIQPSYAIGVSRPTSFYVNTHGDKNVDHQRLEKVLQELVNLYPRGIPRT